MDLDLLLVAAALGSPGAREQLDRSAAGRWLIWSHEHGAWWRPNELGYTTTVVYAGHYAEEAARKICKNAAYGWRDGPPPEVMVLADSPNLADAVARATEEAITNRKKAGNGP